MTAIAYIAGDGAMTWHAADALPMALAALVAVVILVLWLYPPQLRFISRPFRWFLPALRIIALGALALSLLKPAMIRARAATQPRDALVILVDRSRSMSVIDASRTPAEWVALADALNLLPQGVQRRDPAASFDAPLNALKNQAETVHSLRAQVEMARRQPERFEQARAQLDQAMLQYSSGVAALVLRSRSFPPDSPIAAGVDELSKTSMDLPPDAWLEQVRAGIARVEASLSQIRAAADGELYQQNEAVKAKCDELAARSRIDLAIMAMSGMERSMGELLGRELPAHLFSFGGDEVREEARPVDAGALRADAAGTDIHGALRGASVMMRGLRQARAYVVLSDGRAVGADAARSARAIDAPVYAINVAQRQPPPDVSVARVSVPARQFVGQTIPVRLEVRQTGLSGVAVDVRLSSGQPGGGAPIEQQQRIVLSDAAAEVEFHVSADAAPAQRIEISVDPVPGEATAENNRVVRWVKVISQKLRVAAWSGSPAWDFQYLRNTLARTPWIVLDEAILPGESVKPALTPAEILEKDLIILHDLAAGSLSAEQWRAIDQFVRVRGGSLMLIAGDAHLPAEYGQNELLASLLPYRGGLKPVWRVWPGQTPAFQLVPAPGTEAIDALRLSDDAVEGRQRWNVLPGWFRYLSIAELKNNTTPLLIERDSKAPVLTESRLGLGRVLFFGGNETWRWRYKSGEALQDRFWLQLTRYAAGEAYAAENGHGASLDLDALTAEPGQSVRVRARVRDADGAPSPAAQQTLVLLRAGKELGRQTMNLIGPEASGRYETVLAMPEEQGDYQVQLVADPPVQMDLRVERSFEAEMADVSGDEAALRRLAQQSGGEYLPIERISELRALLESRPVEKTLVAEYPLWDSPYLFLFVVACLGTEWALRKAVGLA